jgi:hypothetical protein
MNVLVDSRKLTAESHTITNVHATQYEKGDSSHVDRNPGIC